MYNTRLSSTQETIVIICHLVTPPLKLMSFQITCKIKVLIPSNTYNPRACVLSTKTEMRNETQGNVTLFSNSAHISTI